MEAIECEGNCIKTHGLHKGNVIPVIVKCDLIGDMKFNYCENAIEEDRSRGFIVEINENN